MASPAAAMRSPRSASRRPSSALTRAAAALMRPSQRATGAGIGSPETGKFSIAFRVSEPQSSWRSSTLTLLSLVGVGRAHAPGEIALELGQGIGDTQMLVPYPVRER